MLCFHRPGLRSCDADTRGQPGGGIAQDLSVAEAQSFDPALLPQGERDEEAQLNEFFSGEVPMQFFPECIIGNFRIPDNRAGIGQRDFFPL